MRVAQRGGDLWRRDPRPGVLVIVAGAALAAFLGLVLAVLVSPAFVAVDQSASELLRRVSFPGLEPFLSAVTHTGDFVVVFVATLVAVAVLVVRGSRTEAVLVGATMAIGTGLGAIAKEIVERARPGLEYARITLPDSYSFPSGHALATFLFCALIAFLVSLEARTLRTRAWTFAACIAVPLLVALSRVYLGAHWFGDVIASWVLGVGIMSIAAAVYFAAPAHTDRR